MTEPERPDDARALWQHQDLEVSAPAPAEIRAGALALQSKVRARNAAELAAAATVVAVLGVYAWVWTGLLFRSGCALAIAGALMMARHLYRAGSWRGVPVDGASCLAFQRRELARQRDLLRSVGRWYLAPMAPGMILVILGRTHADVISIVASTVVLLLCAAAFVRVLKINASAAAKLQLELDALPACDEGVEGP